MIDLKGKSIKVESKLEFYKLIEIAKNNGYEWNGKPNRNIDPPETLYPLIITFSNSKTILWSGDGRQYDFKFNNNISPISDEMTAREFLEKLIKHLNCNGRDCEKCKWSSMNNKFGKQLCRSDIWDKSNIDYLIELVSDDDPIYHPLMDNIRAANFIDNVLGGKELSKEEEEALKFAVEKLREIG